MEISDRMVGRKVKCIGCGARVMVPEKVRLSRRKSNLRGRRRPLQELRQIALYQKAICICILVYVVAMAAQFLLPVELRPILAVVALPACITAAVFVFLLSLRLYSVGVGVLFGLLTLIPLVGLVTLLVLSSKATGTLQMNGYKVGLLGADLSQFDEPDREE